MKIQYLLVIALVSSTFAQQNTNHTNQLFIQQENQVNNNAKSDTTNNLQNVQNSVQTNNNQNNNSYNTQQMPTDISTNTQNISQNNTQQNIPETNLKNIKERCESIINLVLGKIPDKIMSIDKSYNGFPSTIYKILKENNVTDYNTIAQLWIEMINKDQVGIESFKLQLEEYAKNNNLPKYLPTDIKEVVNHFLNYYYPTKFNKYLDAISSSTEFPNFVKNYIEFGDMLTNSLQAQIHPNDASIVFNKIFNENKQKIIDKFNIIKNEALDSEKRMYFPKDSDNGQHDTISMYLVPLFMSDFEQNITNINNIEGLREFISSDMLNNPANYMLNRHNAIYSQLKKNNPKEDSKFTMYIDYLVYCVENYSTSAIIHCVQNYVKHCKEDPETDKEYSISKLLLNAIKKSPNQDAYKDILGELEKSAAKY